MNRRIVSVHISLALLLALLMAVFCGCSALSESEWHLFETIEEWTEGSVPESASAVMQRDIYQETVNNVEITIREAGYDGRTLFLEYSFRMLDVDKPLGLTAAEAYGNELPEDMEPDQYVYSMTEDAEELLYNHNVGWWIDGIWINGKELGDMPDGSGQYVTGTGTPGELLETDFWRLDNIGVFLEGNVQISLPIGDMQDFMDYLPYEHPDRADADGNMLLPDKGMITFEYDAKDILSNVQVFRSDDETVLPLAAVKVSEAAFSPVITYIKLDLSVNQDALAAFIEENGEGYYDEDGELLWPFGGMDIFGSWLESLQLTDGSGTILFPENWGPSEYGDETAEFLYPCLETLPDELYLAPVNEEGNADLTLAVPVLPASL